SSELEDAVPRFRRNVPAEREDVFETRAEADGELEARALHTEVANGDDLVQRAPPDQTLPADGNGVPWHAVQVGIGQIVSGLIAPDRKRRQHRRSDAVDE